MSAIGVVVVGAGLIGRRRAFWATRHESTRLVAVCDCDSERAQKLGEEFAVPFYDDWQRAVIAPESGVVVVCTPNAHLCPIGRAAMEAGKHVFLEKPFGRNLDEALELTDAAQRTGRILKIGFNHRYHPAISQLYQLQASGSIGRLCHLRARYGHGGRPGYENEWRGNAELAGGGVLTDQGVHLADLTCWLMGLPDKVFGHLATHFWPIQPLEDTASVCMMWDDGRSASLSCSWTQWKNLFQLELFGSEGSLVAEGLGGSYGPERLVLSRRNPVGGPPLQQEFAFPQQFDPVGSDMSWKLEWDDFVAGLQGGQYSCDARESLRPMAVLEALHRSAACEAVVRTRIPVDHKM